MTFKVIRRIDMVRWIDKRCLHIGVVASVLLGTGAASGSVIMDWGTAYNGNAYIYNVPGGTQLTNVGPWASASTAFENLEVSGSVAPLFDLSAKVGTNYENGTTNQYYYFSNSEDNIGFARFETYGTFNSDIDTMEIFAQNYPVDAPNPPQGFQIRVRIGDNLVYNSGPQTWDGGPLQPAPHWFDSHLISGVSGKTFEIIVEMNGLTQERADANLNVWFKANRFPNEVPGLASLAPLAGLALARRRRR